MIIQRPIFNEIEKKIKRGNNAFVMRIYRARLKKRWEFGWEGKLLCYANLPNQIYEIKKKWRKKGTNAIDMLRSRLRFLSGFN